MRKITSQKEKDKKKKLIITIGGLFLIVIMFFSVLGYSFQGMMDKGSKKITYNEFEFINQNGLWFVEGENFNLEFSYNPNEVEQIGSEINLFENYYQATLYIYSESPEAKLEISRNLDQFILRRQPACPEGEENCDEKWPVKTCESRFIIIQESNQSMITQKENCVFIQGPQENLTQLADEFLFKIFEIEQ